MKLNAIEASHLLELQLELEEAKTDFMAVASIANSDFLKHLSVKRRVELEKENLKLFQLISTEDFKKKEI